jgi:hypothetical protein
VRLLADNVAVVTEPGALFSLSGPGGERPVMGEGAVLLPPPGVPGRYVLKRDGKPIDAVEVLPIDASESDLRTRASGRVPARVGVEPAWAALAPDRSPWPLLVMLALLGADFALTARRRG